MAKVVHIFEELAKSRSLYALYDDFDWFVTAHKWSSTFASTGTATIPAGTTVLALATAATLADDTYVATTNPVFPIVNNRPIYAECLLQFTEANVNNANVAFGFASGVATGLVASAAAGMRTTGTVIAIHKVAGETVWRCTTRNGATVTTNTSTTTAGGAAQQIIAIELVERDDLGATVVYRVDGRILRDAATGSYIRHTFLYAGATNCALFAGLKAGSASAETINVDFLGAAYHR